MLNKDDRELFYLARIATALERIAAAVEPNKKKWTTEREDAENLHSMLYRLVSAKFRK